MGRRQKGLGLSALLAVLCGVSSANSQGDPAKAWLQVPPSRSAIVLVIYGRVRQVNLSGVTLTAKGTARRVLSKVSWERPSPFVHQYRIAPGSYRIFFPGPLKAITVDAKKGTFVTIVLKPLPPRNGRPRVQVEVSEGSLASSIVEAGTVKTSTGNIEAALISKVNTIGNELIFDTNPVWPIGPAPRPGK